MYPYAPDTCSINAQGHLTLADYDLVELASRFQTPLYVLDEVSLRNAARAYKQALAEHYPDSLPIFASKALCVQAVFAILAQEGFGLDVVSSGELLTAQSIDFPAAKIYLHGNNKSAQEIQAACHYGTKIVLDNFHDLELLSSLDLAAKVLIRFTPGIECHTHDYIKTGQIDSKFGFDLNELEKAIELTLQNPKLELLGLHLHIGSQIFEKESFADAAEIALQKYKLIKDRFGITLPELNAGGGLGVHYTNSDDPPSIEESIAGLAKRIKDTCQALGLALPRLIIEPGRSLVAKAGLTLYEVGSEKLVSTGKHYISVDGGMADNPRSITYGAKYIAHSVTRAQAEHNKTFCLAGRFCESGDILIEAALLPAETKAKDLVAIFTTGAYNFAMSSNYNRVPKAAMVLVQNGEAEIILKRETDEELLRNDLMPPRLALLQSTNRE